MKDNGGKVILALLAGASAGIVAGLLLAPETGSDTRSSLGKSLGKFSGDLNKLVQDGLAKLNDLKGDTAGGDQADRSGAEDALAGINEHQDDTKRTAGTSAAASGGQGSASTASSSQGGVSGGGFAEGGTTGGSGVGS